MGYIQNTPEERQEMLEAVGLEQLEQLFESIPRERQLQRPLQIPAALTELELTEHMERLARANASCAERVSFLGGGSYDHFIPAIVDAVAGRGEFYTAYTPYQAEASQGSLQAFFEFQTLVCQLTGMDVANASLYDGGSAVVEAVLMAASITRRLGRVVMAGSVHPEFRQITATYLENLEPELVSVPAPEGTVDPEAVAAALTDTTSCVVVQQPNFFGCLEDVRRLAELTHARGALLVASVDPLGLGLLARPSEYGADIVVAEGQGLGTPLQYGGPYLGLIACRGEYMRKLPGRIVGQTTDGQGRRAFVLTLQTREQHIRREKATSNICTNQGLLALRASVYLAAMGPRGMRQAAELCCQKAHYAAKAIAGLDGFSLRFDRPFFKEFVVRSEVPVSPLLEALGEEGFHAGIPLGRWEPELADCFLAAVTEKRTKIEIDRLTRALDAAARRSADAVSSR